MTQQCRHTNHQFSWEPDVRPLIEDKMTAEKIRSALETVQLGEPQRLTRFEAAYTALPKLIKSFPSRLINYVGFGLHHVTLPAAVFNPLTPSRRSRQVKAGVVALSEVTPHGYYRLYFLGHEGKFLRAAAETNSPRPPSTQRTPCSYGPHDQCPGHGRSLPTERCKCGCGCTQQSRLTLAKYLTQGSEFTVDSQTFSVVSRPVQHVETILMKVAFNEVKVRRQLVLDRHCPVMVHNASHIWDRRSREAKR